MKRTIVLKVFKTAILCMAWGSTVVMAGEIQPVAGNGIPFPAGSGITLSLIKDGIDVTDSWLPEPGSSVQIMVNNGGGVQEPLVTGTPSQAANPIGQSAVVTSAYPGTCTNFPATNPGEPQDTGLDFSLSGGQLTAHDCGGMAVVTVDGFNFVIPSDQDFDGMPDAWEGQFCALEDVTCVQPNLDIEIQGANPEEGDGFSAFDEYRGMYVSLVSPAPGVEISSAAGTHSGHKHIRTSPLIKDVYLSLRNPQCRVSSASTSVGTSLLSGPGSYPTDGTSLFDSLLSLGGAPASSTAARMHLLNYRPGEDNQEQADFDQWVDNLIEYEPRDSPKFKFSGGDDGSMIDRRVNTNAIYPQGALLMVGGAPHLVQKGIRIIECLNVGSTNDVGLATFSAGQSQGTPNLETNSIIFSLRVFLDYEESLAHAGKRGKPSVYTECALDLQSPCVFYQTNDEAGHWSNPTNEVMDATGAPITVDRNFIVSKYLLFLIAMEVGHSVNLIPEIHISDYLSHFAPGTGDNLDQRIVVKDSKREGGVIFQVPSVYGQVPNEGFHLH